MNVGLLWYDADPKSHLEDKLTHAVARYRQKFGRLPDICFVHPQTVNGHGEEGSKLTCRLDRPRATVRVVTATNILPHHFWLGENGKEEPSRAKTLGG